MNNSQLLSVISDSAEKTIITAEFAESAEKNGKFSEQKPTQESLRPLRALRLNDFFQWIHQFHISEKIAGARD